MSDPAVRRATIRDVAARAGVSKSLVALVYASPERVSAERTRRVLDAAGELGFQPNVIARSLAGAADFVTILVADLHNPLFADVVSAARDALAEDGVPSLIAAVASPSGPDALTLDLIRDLRPSGLVVVGSVPDLDTVLALASSRLTIVLASAIAPGSEVTTVRGDDAAGVGLAVDHLVAQGHRRIGFVGGLGAPVAELRRDAYARAMTDRGLGSEVRVGPSGFGEAEGRVAAAALLDATATTRPTAIVAMNDLTAVGALAAASDRGVALAVTGYDNTSVAALPQVSLTSVEPGNAEIGRACAAILSGRTDADTVLVQPRLVIRSSTPAIDRTWRAEDDWTGPFEAAQPPELTRE